MHLSQAHKASVSALATWDGEGDDAVLASGDITGCISIHRIQGSIGQTQVHCSDSHHRSLCTSLVLWPCHLLSKPFDLTWWKSGGLWLCLYGEKAGEIVRAQVRLQVFAGVHSAAVTGLAFAMEGSTLVSCGADGLLVFRQLSPGESRCHINKKKIASVFIVSYFRYTGGACHRFMLGSM